MSSSPAPPAIRSMPIKVVAPKSKWSLPEVPWMTSSPEPPSIASTLSLGRNLAIPIMSSPTEPRMRSRPPPPV